MPFFSLKSLFPFVFNNYLQIIIGKKVNLLKSICIFANPNQREEYGLLRP